MAIKNDLLGGTDWIDTEVGEAVDLNDTFDAAVAKIQTLTVFWLNSFLYTVYDDFGSGPLDTDKWTVNAGTVAWSNTNNAGNTTGEMKITGTGTNGIVESDAIPTNRHIHFNWAADHESTSQTCYVDLGNATDGWTRYTVMAGTDIGPVQLGHFLIIAKGSNQYDIYNGGKRLATDLTKANGMQIKLESTNGQYYIDEVRYSTGEVS